jgi:hypothetical protein
MRQAVMGLILVVAAASRAAPATGGEPAEAALDRHARAIDGAAQTPSGQAKVASRVAQDLNATCRCGSYSPASVQAQRAQNGWGWGEVVIANRMAQALVPGILRANPTLTPAQALARATAQVTTARSGTGWGAMAKANGLKVGDLVSSVEKSARAVEKSERAAGPGGAKGHDKGTTAAADKGHGASRDRGASADHGNTGGFGGGAGGGGGHGGGKGGGEGSGGGGGKGGAEGGGGGGGGGGKGK